MHNLSEWLRPIDILFTNPPLGCTVAVLSLCRTMEKISFRVCVVLWLVALGVLVAAVFYGGIILISLFIFFFFSAAGYNWFHSQRYGEVLRFTVGMPNSTIEFVDATRNNFNEHDGIFFHPDTPSELIESLVRLERESVLVRVLMGHPETGKVETVKVGMISWTPGSVAVPRLTYYDGLSGEVLEDHRIVRIINVVTSVVEYEGAGRMVDE